MAGDEQSGFAFVDKRTSGEGSAEAPAPESTAAAPTEEADATEHAPHGPGELPRLTMRDRLLMCIDILHQGAWIGMGLIADPATGQIEKDLEGARKAIDSVGVLVDKLEGSLDASAYRELQTLVSNLRINFVEQSRR